MALGSKPPSELEHINEAWEHAQEQLLKLRAEVQRSVDMAQLSLTSKFLAREHDKALRDLGEVVWKQMKAGKLQLPPACTPEVKGMLELERREANQINAIQDILQEGAEAADRLHAKPSTTNTGLAPKTKKR